MELGKMFRISAFVAAQREIPMARMNSHKGSSVSLRLSSNAQPLSYRIP